MRVDIREQLYGMRDVKYQKFSAKLIPGIQHMLGIRLPQLRALAKEIAKSDWREVLEEPDIYFEERMLRGLILSYASKELDEILPYVAEYIPLVDNWSVCDSVFMGMHIFQQDREKSFAFIQPYLDSRKEFEIRIAVVIMMQHLLKCNEHGKKISRLRKVDMVKLSNHMEVKGLYVDRVLQAVSKVDTTAYYASMAVAWLIAESFCCYPYTTYEFLKKDLLDDRTYNKSIQKISESRIPTDAVKELLGTRKRNSK